MTITTSGIFEGIAALSQVVIAGSVSAGVWVAYRQLGSWRTESQLTKRAVVAEELISAVHEADEALRFVRSPWSSVPADNLSNKMPSQWRERLVRLDKRRDDFLRLRRAQTRCRAFIGDSDVDASVEELFKIRQSVWAALETLDSGTEDGGDEELREFYLGLSWKVWGGYNERDKLGLCQEAALSTIEDRLYPILRLQSSN
ncbi:hypothetical protein Q5Y75_21120 [Ruegeria sp. 2205SS24-7]|uniref:hypothetical protein n=1 Tax=Ruegeria discodermiae TaxID=3064389 RepID=UPI002742374E|nr:hypothetical protein [Ruegeria sp. 2205SS24-7]MDP5219730.1 hypothetical protein [Ruegeria sp. 2205SS24-7]